MSLRFRLAIASFTWDILQVCRSRSAALRQSTAMPSVEECHSRMPTGHNGACPPLAFRKEILIKPVIPGGGLDYRLHRDGRVILAME